MMEDTEQAEVQDEVITPDQVRDDIPSADKDIKGILADALEGDKSGASKDQPTSGNVIEAEQPLETEAPFLELVNGEGKLPFKTEEDFLKFLESNQVLKDGWLRQSDYTRKTQEVAQMREQFEKSREEEEKSWNGVKPDGQSMNSLRSIWSVYNQGEPQVQDAINKFVNDINMIAKGQAPVGPIKDLLGGSQPNGSANTDPAVGQLNQKIAMLEQKLSKFQSQTEQERQASISKENETRRVEAEKSVDSWISAKEKAGSKVGQDELMAMADLMSIVDEKGQPKLSLDEAHNMALAKLGKLQGSVAKQVMSNANKAKKTSPLAPGSRGNANELPESNTIKGILAQGLNHMSGE
jgi:hypothetical protein